jgi:hypothetical protein
VLANTPHMVATLAETVYLHSAHRIQPSPTRAYATVRKSMIQDNANTSGPVGLPAVVEELLIDVAADGFTLHCCGPKATPNALVASYEWIHYVDVLTIQDFDRVITARLPKRGNRVDIFAPEAVVWTYEGPPEQALRALLDLVHPDHPDAPTIDYSPPAGLYVPRAQQRPMTIRLPSPTRATVRATRLATLATPGK